MLNIASTLSLVWNLVVVVGMGPEVVGVGPEGVGLEMVRVGSCGVSWSRGGGSVFRCGASGSWSKGGSRTRISGGVPSTHVSGARHRALGGNGGEELSGSKSRIDHEESYVVDLGSSDGGRTDITEPSNNSGGEVHEQTMRRVWIMYYMDK